MKAVAVMLSAIVSFALLLINSAHAAWNDDGTPIVIKETVAYKSICSDGSGGFYVAWDCYESSEAPTLIYVLRIDADGTSLWPTGPKRVCSLNTDQSEPLIIPDLSGGAVVLWSDFRSSAFSGDIWAQRIGPVGQLLWANEGVPVCEVWGSQYFYKAETVWDSYHQVYVVNVIWMEHERTQGGEREIYIQSLRLADGLRRWTPADGILVVGSPHIVAQHIPQLVTDASGNSLIFFALCYSSQIATQTIWGHKVDVVDGDLLWPSPALVFDYAGLDQSNSGNHNLRAISDNSNGAILVSEFHYLDYSSNWVRSGIRKQRIGPNGNRLWPFPPNGSDFLCQEHSYIYTQTKPNVTASATGNAIVSFCAEYDNVFSIQAQRVGMQYGDAQWAPAIGKMVAGPLEVDPDRINIVQGRNSSAIISWEQYDGALTVWNQYAQMIDQEGNTLWSNDLRQITNKPLDQMHNELVSDGAGGAFVVWNDYSWGEMGIYASRVIPEMACSIQKQYIDHYGNPTNKSILTGCPQGDMHALKVELEFYDGIVTGNIVRTDITLDKPQGDISFWEIGPITAEQDATSENGYCSNIVQKYISGCNACGECAPSSVAVRLRGIRIGYVRDLLINSVDMTNDGYVGIADLSMFSSHFPPYPYSACADFNADGLINAGDLGLLSMHYGPPNHAAPPGSTRLDASKETPEIDKEAKIIATAREKVGEKASDIPLVSELHDNYPNPFNPTTQIAFGLAECCRVQLKVYDVAGRLVRVLADDVLAAGVHERVWDGRDSRGLSAASGVYFYRLSAKDFIQTKKMVLLR